MPKFFNTDRHSSEESGSLEFKLEKFNSPKSNIFINHEFDAIFVAKLLNRQKLTIFVSGKKFQTLWSSLRRIPNTRLGWLEHCVNASELNALCDYFDLDKSYFYFHTGGTCFPSILNMYRTGSLHLSSGSCIAEFCSELSYWGIREEMLEFCCQGAFMKGKDVIYDIIQSSHASEVKYLESKDLFPKWRFTNLQRRIYNLFENNDSSLLGLIISFISNWTTLFSTLLLCITTMSTVYMSSQFQFICEKILLSWFTFEFLIRFLVSPTKKTFILSWINFLDFVAVVAMILQELMEDNESSPLPYLRLLRLFRILRIARHSTGLQTLWYTFRQSSTELGLVAVLLLISVVLGGLATYLLDFTFENEKHINVFDSLWWATLTLTTVGNDIGFPKHFLGKIAGSCCCAFGIIIVSLPIPIIVNKFHDYYKENIYLHRERKRQEMLKQMVTKSSSEIISELYGS